jgi:hypothetical protein
MVNMPASVRGTSPGLAQKRGHRQDGSHRDRGGNTDHRGGRDDRERGSRKNDQHKKCGEQDWPENRERPSTHLQAVGGQFTHQRRHSGLHNGDAEPGHDRRRYSVHVSTWRAAAGDGRNCPQQAWFRRGRSTAIPAGRRRRRARAAAPLGAQVESPTCATRRVRAESPVAWPATSFAWRCRLDKAGKVIG